MKIAILSAAIALVATPIQAAETYPGVVVTPIAKSTLTITGQPIVLPRKSPQVLVSTYEIAPGTTLPDHRHPYARYAYVLSGTLRVTNTETGKIEDFKPGQFVIESINQWHKGANIGSEPVKLLVIDQVEKDRNPVETRKGPPPHIHGIAGVKSGTTTR